MQDAAAASELVRAARMLWITNDRVFYAGLLGAPSLHSKGAITVYAALEGTLQLTLPTGRREAGELAVVQRHVQHQVTCEGRHVLVLLIEPEWIDARRLPSPLHANGTTTDANFAARVREAYRTLALPASQAPGPADFDRAFFGAPLPERTLDARIADVLLRARSDPSALDAAKACADDVGLSFSRFLHLFKQEVGASFREVRTWKRARSLLPHVVGQVNLAHVAQDIGYPDSTHFSRSIRQNYGLRPRDIIAGSRRLRLIVDEPARFLAT